MNQLGAPTILFPVEKIAREFDSKLVMAIVLAARGFRTVVGQKDAVGFIGRESGPVIWQGKDIISTQEKYTSDRHLADRLLNNGSAIMYLHDEGGMFQANSWKEQVIGKHQLEALRRRAVNRICAWGERQRQVMTDYAPEIGNCIRVTGTPRFDICSSRFEWITREEVRAIRARYGNFVLACTRFGSIANKKGVHHAFERKLVSQVWPAGIGLDKVADLWLTKWRRDVHDFAEFVVLVKELATAYPERQIVLRPHPSEDLLFYETVFAPYGNIVVIREGNVLNWIRAADLLVHSNCTTGIEAVLAGRPVLNFLPGEEDRANLDVEVAREAGVVAKSIPGAMEKVSALLAGDAPPHVWSQHARSILRNLETDSIPILIEESIEIANAHGIGGSRIVLPGSSTKHALLKFYRGITGQRLQKPGLLRPDHIEMIVDGCRAEDIGVGRIAHMTAHYVVIDPT